MPTDSHLPPAACALAAGSTRTAAASTSNSLRAHDAIPAATGRVSRGPSPLSRYALRRLEHELVVAEVARRRLQGRAQQRHPQLASAEVRQLLNRRVLVLEAAEPVHEVGLER